MSAPIDAESFVRSFRHSSPYINSHRGRTFVVAFGGEAVAAADFFNLVHDLALLNSLGIRLVLVHGARPQIEAKLRREGAEIRYCNGLRITGDDALACVCEASGDVRREVEARLSMGLGNSPMQGVRIRVTSGNFVTAKPVGVRQGVDFGHTGEVRRVDAEGIHHALDGSAIVLLSPIGYSPTGEVFNVSAEEIAVFVATAIRSDKLIFLTEDPVPSGKDGVPISDLTPAQAQALLEDRTDYPAETVRHLGFALDACRRGVKRTHLVHRAVNGALLLELFTRDGSGTLVNADLYEGVREARIDDVGGILALIAPLEQDGTLVRRSRERLEAEIERFAVVERDGSIIACAALYPIQDEGFGELACVATQQEYRGDGRAEELLRFLEEQARHMGITSLFVLTTRTAHWFRERGFLPASIDALPLARQSLYNLQRNSKVFVKKLQLPGR